MSLRGEMHAIWPSALARDPVKTQFRSIVQNCVFTDRSWTPATYIKALDPPAQRCLSYPSAASRGGLLGEVVGTLLHAGWTLVHPKWSALPTRQTYCEKAQKLFCARVSRMTPLTHNVSFYYGVISRHRLCWNGFSNQGSIDPR